MRIADLDDTIAAVSSPPGTGLRAVVRISGPGAFAAGRSLVAFAPPAVFPARVSGRLRLEAAQVPAVAYLFARPRSYTGQDVVELHLPGSPVLLEMVLERTYRLGARPAGPGEFTARAYLNGKMNLLEAEAVAAVIAAQSDQQLRAARGLLAGRLTRSASRAQGELAELLALVEAGIDFCDEDIDFITPQEALARISGTRSALEDLRDGSVMQERLALLPAVVLSGGVNAGKSTLMNRLTGMDRSICSPVPGTTRDVLSAPLSLAHGECLLLDAAGAAERSDDPVAAAAAVAAQRAAAESDLVCLVVEAGGPFEAAPGAAAPDVVVLSKCDTLGRTDRAAAIERVRKRWGGPVIATSAFSGEGLAELKNYLDARLFEGGGTVRSEALVLSARHRDAIASAIEALDRAESLARSHETGELLAMEIREAIDRLGALAGEIPDDEILDRIFSTFCIGK